ncbi:MAG: DUF192 domain-containing protein [Oligosphaeraceae bacterium]
MRKKTLIFLLFCLWGAVPAPSGEILRDVEIGPQRFEVVELACTVQEKAQGMQGRTHLPDTSAMAFLSLPPRPQVFWMKNTRIPLDVIFLDASGRILQISSMAVEEPRRAGESESRYHARLKRYTCVGEVFCVLEIRGGLAGELGLAAGDSLPAFSLAALARYAVPGS